MSIVEARSRAVVSIQLLLSKHKAGTSPYRVAERALDLAFNCPYWRGGDLERELLEDAEDTIQLQLRAGLIEALPAVAVLEPGCVDGRSLRARHAVFSRVRHPRRDGRQASIESRPAAWAQSGGSDGRRC